MPLLETKGAASAQGFGLTLQQAAANYIEDVFSTWLYTGQGAGSSQTITNGIDLSTKGGLVWLKNRNVAYNNNLFDTARGVNKRLFSNSTSAELNTADSLTAFNSNGFTIGTVDSGFSGSGENIASWTFRKQPKFFDVVTYTGNGSVQNIAHNLGSVPGCIIVKGVSGDFSTGNWAVYHRSLTETTAIQLNNSNASFTTSSYWNNTAPTSTQFTVGTAAQTGAPNTTYVAYIFAHNAGGFGLTGTDNVISCGGGTFDGSGYAVVNLGYEPQWVLIKSTTYADNWYLADTMRGATAFLTSGTNSTNLLYPNLSNAETSTSYGVVPNATGFTFLNGSSGQGYIYIAIRRGPMKTPTSGTSVFSPVSQAGGGTVTTNFVVDGVISKQANNALAKPTWFDRLRGSSATSSAQLFSSDTSAETDPGVGLNFANNTGYVDSAFGAVAGRIYWNLRRAPGFFDVVCYTGNNVYQQAQTHNLGVAPELIIVKRRNSTANWAVGCNFTNTEFQYLNLNSGADGGNTNAYTTGGFFGGKPTATTFILAQNATTNASGGTYVAYLFATLAGVSKVGTYTGTGAAQTINCGFTGGARFVLIKRLGDNVDPGIGDWYVYDSARGISSGNDPYLLINSTAAEVTSTNYVDTASTGFQVTAAAPAALNASGGTFLFLAVA